MYCISTRWALESMLPTSALQVLNATDCCASGMRNDWVIVAFDNNADWFVSYVCICLQYLFHLVYLFISILYIWIWNVHHFGVNFCCTVHIYVYAYYIFNYKYIYLFIMSSQTQTVMSSFRTKENCFFLNFDFSTVGLKFVVYYDLDEFRLVYN